MTTKSCAMDRVKRSDRPISTSSAALAASVAGDYAQGPVVTVAADDTLPSVLAELEARSISAAPVLAKEGHAIGVISRSDLLRIGANLAVLGRGRSHLVELPEAPAATAMRRGVLVVRRSTSVPDAAGKMVKHRVHRLFVEDEGRRLVGVFGTREVLFALADARVQTPLGEVVSHKALVVPLDASISLATSRLLWAEAQGLVVVDPDGWPIGLFTRREALLSGALPPDTRVVDAMSEALSCMSVDTPLDRAAARAAESGARRVLVVDQGALVGVVTPLGFARAAASARGSASPERPAS